MTKLAPEWVRTSDHTGRGNPGVDMPLGGCSWLCSYGVDITGWRRASSISSGHGGYGAAVAGRGRLSSLSSFCPVIRTTTPAGYEGVVRSPHASKLWSPPGPLAPGSLNVTSHQTPLPDYGTACTNHRRQPEC